MSGPAITYRWPEDRQAAVADWLRRYPPPAPTPELLRVARAMVTSYIEDHPDDTDAPRSDP